MGKVEGSIFINKNIGTKKQKNAALQVSKKQHPQLDKGWILEITKSQGCKTKGKLIYYWYSPKTNTKFQSRLDAKRFQ